MRIVLAGGTTPELEPYAATLEQAGHAVKVVADVSLPNACVGEKPHLVLLEVTRDGGGAIEIIRRVRDLAGVPPFLFYLLGGSELSQGFLRDAYDAGIDGDLRQPFGPEFLASRVNAATRVARRPEQAPIAKPASPARPVNGAAPKLVGGAAPAAIAAAGATAPDSPMNESEGHLTTATQSQTWRNASKLIQDMGSKFLALPVTLGAEAAAPIPSLGCAISLSHAAHQLEARIAIGADSRSARRLAVHMFGDEGDDLVGDMLNELANLFMGAVKTSFSAESFAFTGGLPDTISADYVLRPSATYKRQETFSMAIADSRLLVYIGMRSKANLFLASSGLREGMVVAKDVFNARGLMLVNGGTRLSLNMVEKLRSLLTPKHLVEVTAP
ncbi:MAG: hypothetical protein HOO96_28755 [Polyangiaceae bacterium]|nr:hypothetical protein [Polyangiaceae bacterium]